MNGSTDAPGRRWDLLVIVAAIASVTLLVWLGRGLTFFADEWAVITDRPISVETYLRPFNEHWLGLTTLVHRALFEVVGLGTYVPYLALLAILHAIVGVEVYLVARRTTTRPVAAAIAVVVLFFGSGFENLFWAMQIGFVGAAALGFGAVLLLDRPTRPRVAVATVLLTLGVTTSGFGLFMLAFAGLDLLFDRERRRWFPALLVPGFVYLAWYLALGRSGLATHGDPFTLARIAAVPRFVLEGLGAAAGGAVGGGPLVGLVVVALVAGLVAWRAAHGHSVPARALAATGAIVVMYALLGLVRAGLEEEGIDATYYTRYTYLSGMFALLGIAALVGRASLPAAPRARSIALVAAGSVVAVSLSWNLVLLVQGRTLFAQRAEMTRALVELAVSPELPSRVDPELELVLVPSPVTLKALVATHGSPLADTLAGDAVAPISERTRDEAVQRAQNPPAWILAERASR